MLLRFLLFRALMKAHNGEDQALEVLTGVKGRLQAKVSSKKW